MSLGFGGVARLVLSEEKGALYLYKCENLNKPDNNPLEDGEIYIELEPIFSAYIPKRTKRYPEGIPIHFPENIDLDELFAKGSLAVKNCSNVSFTDARGIDRQAITLIWEIALEIQLSGSFPPKIGYFK